MTKSILKLVVIGMLIGITVFFMPMFILGIFIFFVLIRFFIGNSIRRNGFRKYRLAFADKIRSMNDEEYVIFKQKMDHFTCCHSAPKQEFN